RRVATMISEAIMAPDCYRQRAAGASNIRASLDKRTGRPFGRPADAAFCLEVDVLSNYQVPPTQPVTVLPAAVVQEREIVPLSLRVMLNVSPFVDVAVTE